MASTSALLIDIKLIDLAHAKETDNKIIRIKPEAIAHFALGIVLIRTPTEIT